MSDISKWKENYQKKLSNSTKNFETISSKLAEKEAESKTQSKQLAGVRRDLLEEREKIENECLSDLETEKSNLESFNTERDEIQEKLSAMEEGKRLFKVLHFRVTFLHLFFYIIMKPMKLFKTNGKNSLVFFLHNW